jgi:hypothetical protein
MPTYDGIETVSRWQEPTTNLPWKVNQYRFAVHRIKVGCENYSVPLHIAYRTFSLTILTQCQIKSKLSFLPLATQFVSTAVHFKLPSRFLQRGGIPITISEVYSANESTTMNAHTVFCCFDSVCMSPGGDTERKIYFLKQQETGSNLCDDW